MSSGHVNNTHYWAVENPHWVRSVPFQHRWSLNAWCDIIRDFVTGPYFFGETVASNSCTLLQLFTYAFGKCDYTTHQKRNVVSARRRSATFYKHYQTVVVWKIWKQVDRSWICSMASSISWSDITRFFCEDLWRRKLCLNRQWRKRIWSKGLEMKKKVFLHFRVKNCKELMKRWKKTGFFYTSE